MDSKNDRLNLLQQRYTEKIFQRGVEVPKPGDQAHLLIIRLDLAPKSKDRNDIRDEVKKGLERLCGLFDRLDSGEKKLDFLKEDGVLESRKIGDFGTSTDYKSPVNFTATIGFGIGFFDRLGIDETKRPKKLKTMPDHDGLGDVTPYSLAQTDLIIQIGSNDDFINRWVFENALRPDPDPDNPDPLPEDIVTAVEGWATIVDVHSGFQRVDGRNLMGFNDGVSNPNPGSGASAVPDKPKFDDVVWVKDETNSDLNNGTYMVFQKISHDLDQWRELKIEEQEEWVGRDKVTGLLLHTLEDEDNEILKKNLNSPDPAKAKQARIDLANHLKGDGDPTQDQTDPTNTFYDKSKFRDHVPAWSHIRKVNPRGEEIRPGQKRIGQRILFRRGYPFIQSGLNDKTISGLLFVSFQNDIDKTFEFIKKSWAGSKTFPVPAPRPDFTDHEIKIRKSQGRFTAAQLNAIITPTHDSPQEILLGLDDPDVLEEKKNQVEGKDADPDTQNTGREGLAGPSELGVVPSGEFLAIVPFGGGYYFVPPIPNKKISDIGQQFF